MTEIKTKFEKPVITKKSNRVQNDKGVVIELSEITYQIGENVYPKIQIKTWKQDEEGFPIASPKSLNLPLDCKEMLDECFSTFQ